MSEQIKCPFCKREMESVGFDIIATSIDEYGEPDEFAIVEVFVCHHCKIFMYDTILDGLDEMEAEYKIVEEFKNKWAAIPKGYVGLP